MNYVFCFEEVLNIQQLEQLLEPDSQTLVLFDVDDTLITPKAKIFRKGKHSYPHLMDDLKKLREKNPQYNEVIAHWRQSRQVELVELAWPTFLAELQKKATVYALTQMDTGAYSSIPSMEHWRHKELQGLGITFTEILGGERQGTLLAGPKGEASFFHGIAMTGPFKKGQVVKALLEKGAGSFKRVVLVDDRASHLRDVGDVCEELGLEFLGVHYLGVEQLDKIGGQEADPEVVALQKVTLLEEKRWLEDDEVKQLLLERKL